MKLELVGKEVKWWQLLLLAAIVIALYWPLTQYGYVQDDKTMIGMSEELGNVGAVRWILDPTERIFYRPLGELYCVAVWNLIGMNSVYFHVLSMAMLLSAGLLVMSIGVHLTGNVGVGVLASYLYVGAAHIHLDPQMWMSGVFDNGSVLFALLSLVLFIRGKPGLSAWAFAAALGFKESAVVLPAMVLVWLLAKQGKKAELRGLAWHSFIVAIWFVLKSFGISPFSVPDWHPYQAALIGTHIPGNMLTFLLWLSPDGWMVLLLYSLGLFALVQAKLETRWILILWILLPLILPSLIIDHAYRYYGTLALPAACILWAFGVQSIRHVGFRRFTVIALLAIYLSIGYTFIRGHVDRGINDDIPALEDGYNHLIRKSLRGQ